MTAAGSEQGGEGKTGRKRERRRGKVGRERRGERRGERERESEGEEKRKEMRGEREAYVVCLGRRNAYVHTKESHEQQA